MKKKMAAILALGALCLLPAGCSREAGETMSGEVVTWGGKPLMMELACEDGKNYGFVIDETTELVWKDTSALTQWKEAAPVYDEWEVFGCGMIVTVLPGEQTESADDYVDECVEGWYMARKVTVTGVDDSYFAVAAKPVIYLYPESTAEVTVRLDYDGALTCTYPRYQGGWTVTAQPDGTLTDAAGQTYSYLYWEGRSAADYDFSRGFCVAGEDTAAFLEDALARLGLTRREANEFLVYWLPLMEPNAYNLIAFQSDAYTGKAALQVTPEPDTVLRVFMAWQPLAAAVEIPPQTLAAPERTGFTLVEWGGAQIGG